jgi:hypothetical protein
VQSNEKAERDREREREEELANAFPPEHWSGSESSGTGTRERAGSTASSRGRGGDKELDLPPTTGALAQASSTVFVSGPGSSGPSSSSAYRDPPTGKGNVFEAIAKRDWSGEKNRINSIARAVGNLAKGVDGGAAGGAGLNKANPVRGIKAMQTSAKLKREAEQAGECGSRGIVFWCGR